MNDGSSRVALRFEMLGPIRAFRGAEPVDLGHPRQQAVLALLLLHAPRPVPLTQIVSALWDGDPPENGTDIVQRYIGALRRTLDPERSSLITLIDGGYVIRAGETSVDTGVFRAALARARTEHQTGAIGAATDEIRTALEMWRDEPLTGLSGPIFESARTRLKSERAAAVALLTEPTTPLPPRSPTPSSPTPGSPTPGSPTPGSPTPASEFSPAIPPTVIGGPFPTAPVNPAPPRADALPPTLIAGPATILGPPPRPAAGTARPEPEKPAYPKAVDPWEGHDLFPPDPLAMS